MDARAGELRKHGVRIRLGTQPFQILMMLLREPGEVVLREEIRQRLWPNNTIVEFDHSINAAINRLRAALGEAAGSPHYIETVGSRGYRFLGEVHAGAAAKTTEDHTPIPSPPAVETDNDDDLAGQVISHYRLMDKLGAGGMGVVYHAEDLRLGRHVALKFLPGEMAADPMARQRFEREARAASALNHPNICTIFGVEESEDRLFLSMELLEGITLEARMAGGLMSRSQSLEFAVQICSALDAAHRHGLVHRDIKPANVMLTRTGAKVLDFGLAKMERPQNEPTDAQAGISEKGIILGTLPYMSPEQVEGKTADPRSDIFSFGLMLYEMLTGRRAFEGSSRARLISSILGKEPIWGELPPDLERAVKRCLVKDPEGRWQSAADLRDELEWLAARPASARSRTRFRLHVPLRPALFTAAVAVAACAIGIFLADRPEVDVSQVRFTPMVMDPGYNNFPSWSPDGRSFAYMHNGVLMLRSFDAPVPVRVTSGATSLMFSKDGTRIYYTRETAPAIGRKLWTVAVTGGDPHALPAEDLGAGYLFDGIAASPDGNGIVGLKQESDGHSYSLQISSPAGDPWRSLACPTFQGPFGRAHLRFSPDGRRLLVFLGSQIWIVSWPGVDAYPPRRVFSSVRGLGADWMSDSRHVLMSLAGTDEGQGGGFFVGDTETGRTRPLELRDNLAIQPSAGPGNRFLIPYVDNDNDLMEVPLDGSPLRPLIVTRRSEYGPDWSHGGDQLAYVSSRNGPAEIWIWSPVRNLHRLLVPLHSMPGSTAVAQPAFSPDDRHIAFNAAGSGLWVVPAIGGAPVQALKGRDAALPSWSPDGVWLAYRANINGKLFLEKVRLGDPAHPVTISETVQGVRPIWSPDGKWITLATNEGVSVVTPDGRITRQLFGAVSSWTSTGWSRDGKTLYLAITEGYLDPIPSTLWAINPETAEKRAIGHYQGVWFGGSPQMALSASADGKSLATTIVKPYQYIWLVEGLAPPRDFWHRMLTWLSASR